MNVPELIRRKREGQSIAPEELEAFVGSYVKGQLPDYQMSAFLMAVFFRGMEPEEAAALTRVMRNSGDRYDLASELEGPFVDKHSTGGVGDKVSLILAPLVATCGGVNPMVSGRALGHTGGTLDKLDAIPGYRWNLSEEEFREVLRNVGCAIIGQTENFVPADRLLYRLRDVTATVESIPLICASILSKKAASGAESLVMDVKCGSGAFMDSHEKAKALAQSLNSIGTALGLRMSSLLTQMNQPLGITVGNALEVQESVEVLRGGGPPDIREVTLALAAEMLTSSRLAASTEEARRTLEEKLDSGQALHRFQIWVEAQGGDPRVADEPEAVLAQAPDRAVLEADRSGWITSMQTRQIGVASNILGAGRQRTEDVVDPAVGLEVPVKVGDRVERGQPLVTIHHCGGKGLEQCRRMLREAIVVGEERTEALPLILERVSP